jgi:polysaccharide transporter, PST family
VLIADDPDLGRQAARGASTVLIGQAVRVVLLLVSTVVLSRLLAPTDFGLMAIVLSVVALGELFRDSGLSLASARAVPLSAAQKSNLFWINTGLGLVIAAVAWLLAPAVAAIFRQDSLIAMLQWISIVFIFTGLSTQFRAELNRKLLFVRLTIVDTAPVTIGLVAALVWAMEDQSFWVLIIQQVSTAASGLFFSVVMTRWWPGLPNRSSVYEFLRFGVGLLGTQGLAYLSRNADNILLGLFWGPVQLGFYSRAYQLLMAPMNQLLAPLTRVAVPVLSRVLNDTPRFNRFLVSGQLAGGVSLAVMYAVVFGLAQPLIDLLLGNQWGSVAPLVQALCVGGIFRSLNQVTFWAFVSTGKTKQQFTLHLVTQPLVVAAMAAGLPWGAFGVAIGHSVGYGIVWAVSLWWAARTTPLEGRALLIQSLALMALFIVPIGTICFISEMMLGESILAVIGASVAGSATWVLINFLTVPYARASIMRLISVAKQVAIKRRVA